MRLPFAVLLLAAFRITSADDWPAPQIREVFSHSRNYFVRINPGTSWGDTEGFRGSPKGPFATAEFYRQEKDRSYRLTTTANLLNPVAPVDFFVTDRGFLVTLDNWHNRGYGQVIAFYTPDGKLVRSYDLFGLFTKQEIEAFDHSVSSIAWHKMPGAYIREDQETLYIMGNQPGDYFVFEVTNGSYQYCETRNDRSVCRSSNTNRAWKSYRDSGAGRQASSRPSAR